MEHLHALADLFEASLPFEHLLAAAKLQKNARYFSVPDHQSMQLIEKPTFPVWGYWLQAQAAAQNKRPLPECKIIRFWLVRLQSTMKFDISKQKPPDGHVCPGSSFKDTRSQAYPQQEEGHAPWRSLWKRACNLPSKFWGQILVQHCFQRICAAPYWPHLMPLAVRFVSGRSALLHFAETFGASIERTLCMRVEVLGPRNSASKEKCSRLIKKFRSWLSTQGPQWTKHTDSAMHSCQLTGSILPSTVIMNASAVLNLPPDSWSAFQEQQVNQPGWCQRKCARLCLLARLQSMMYRSAFPFVLPRCEFFFQSWKFYAKLT